MKIIALLAVVAAACLLATPYFYLAPVPGLGVLFLFCLNRNPALGIYLFVFLIPFAAFRKIGPVNLPWVILAATLAVVALRMLSEKRLPHVVQSNLWPFIILLVIASLLSTIFADYPDTAQFHLLQLVAGYAFVFAGMASLSRDAFRSHLPNLVIWSVGLSAVLAIFDSYFGWSLFSQAHLSGALDRAVGGSLDPNNFSVMILFALPIAIHRFLYPGSPTEKSLMLVVVPLMFIALISAFSRSGFLALLICLGLLLVQYRQFLRPRALGFALLFGCLGILVTAVTSPDTFWERQLSLLRWEDKSLSRRSSYLVVGSEAIAQNPLIGSGPGTFIDIFAESEVSQRYARRPEDRFRHAHNTYIEVLVGTGILGFVIFVALNIRAFANFLVSERIYRARGDPEMANLSASVRIGYLTLMAFLFTFSEQYHKHMLLALIFSQGAIYFALREAEARNETDSPAPTLARTE